MREAVTTQTQERRGQTTPALALHGLRKSFGAVEALRGVDFELLRGEVHALVGDNGAGKSTLLKIASGAIQPDEGTMRVNDEPVVFNSPLEARRHGIETVYQDLALGEERSCIANLFAGREICRAGWRGHFGVLDRRAMAAEARRTFEELSITIRDPHQTIQRLSGGQKQGVAIARAARWAKQVVLLDEPTAALGVRQRTQVQELITRLRAKDFGVMLISHDVLETLKIADRVTILRLGERVATRRVETIDVPWVVSAMVGGEDADEHAT